MEKYEVNFKKKYGQNFLKDDSVVQKIINVSDISKNSLVIEVGVGGAILTKSLSKCAKYVLAYEIDSNLEEEIDKRLGCCNNVDVLFEDFLNADLGKNLKKYQYDDLYFISNVPYYITTPIISKLLDSKLSFKKIVMMVQKEVGDRLSASPGNKEYGAISVVLQYSYDIKKEFFVSRNEFVPKPNVDSIVVSFSEKSNSIPVDNYSFFVKLVHDSFQFKRKNIRNNLRNYNLTLVEEILKNHNLALTCRAEDIGVDVFVELANSLSNC